MVKNLKTVSGTLPAREATMVTPQRSIKTKTLLRCLTVKKEEGEVPQPDHVASAVTPYPAPSSLPTIVSSISVTYKVDARPTPQECQWVVDSLSKMHPEVVERNSRRRREILSTCGMQDTIVDGVISTILSQNTTSANSTRAFRRLKQAFPTWKFFIETENAVPKMKDAIRCAGLSEIKAGRIDAMLQTLQEEQGSPSLEYLRELSNDQVKTELTRFKGLGPKTISCVLLFAMGRDEFPVDTHVHRISKLMGFVPSSMNAEKAYLHLNKVVPDPLKLDLHCLLIAHGKKCHRCAARGKPQFPPKDGTKLSCPLVNIHKQKDLFMEKSIQIKKESS